LSVLARLLFAIAVFAALVLLALSVGSGAWLWLLTAATVVLYLYGRTGAYPLLVVGALLAGAALGILLEATLRWSGAFLVSLGTAAVTVEAIEERPGHWPVAVGLAFVGLGLLVGIVDAGPGAVLLASLLVGGAVVWRLLARGR